MMYNSLLAQEMATWAVGKGPAGDLIHDALFRAYFVNNVNIGAVDNLVAIAESIGLSPVECREVLQLRRFRAAVHDDWERSQRRGVTAVPTFAIGSSEVVGAQPCDTLEQLALKAGLAPRK